MIADREPARSRVKNAPQRLVTQYHSFTAGRRPPIKPVGDLHICPANADSKRFDQDRPKLDARLVDLV
jgi:hypothetical protein